MTVDGFSVISHQSSVISHQSSVISHQSSVISHQSSVISHQSSVISHQVNVQYYLRNSLIFLCLPKNEGIGNLITCQYPQINMLSFCSSV
ncbi:Pyridoxamine 5'-phosphate oxidase [Nostoc sphaeroides CCNUC1]|uniref:Pyridoxamine 5'-phosphate oxidase n=1 Tax=Nostoc sphaeroides CCNUC1 TaxID=2653204 RepID=A0A5P8W5R7_9NOSO|nr:Pyridoxamine 5'-phosphate oxidase [Nostoc sphaeroides CCNUC1]